MKKKRPGKRKPYKPPKIKSEKLFERRALACGKNNPNVFSCIASPRQS